MSGVLKERSYQFIGFLMLTTSLLLSNILARLTLLGVLKTNMSLGSKKLLKKQF